MKAKDVDPNGDFERAYAEVAGSPVEAGPSDHAGLVERYNNLVKTGVAYAESELNGASTSTFEIYMGHFRDIGREIITALSRAPEADRSKAARDELVAQAQELDMGYATPPAPQPALALIEELERANMEINRLKAALTMPDADRRLWFISDCLGKRGHFNRSDICEAFGVSVPQASNDISRWVEKHPGAISYNKSSKRYEHTIAALASAKRFRTGE